MFQTVWAAASPLLTPIVTKAVTDWLSDPKNVEKLSSQIQIGITNAVDQAIANATSDTPS